MRAGRADDRALFRPPEIFASRELLPWSAVHLQDWRRAMAGVSVEQGGRGRRTLDSEINMIPMIDLLMVTISFLLITAVWAHSQRLVADAQVPGAEAPLRCGDHECKEEPKLHVDASDPAKFVLAWKEGRAVLRSSELARDPARRPASYPALAAKVAEEWRASGLHRTPSDGRLDRAVVHVADDVPYSELVAVMDAVSTPKRQLSAAGRAIDGPAFDVTLAAH
jgi:biopolymer transport protein ExbD